MSDVVNVCQCSVAVCFFCFCSWCSGCVLLVQRLCALGAAAVFVRLCAYCALELALYAALLMVLEALRASML